MRFLSWMSLAVSTDSDVGTSISGCERFSAVTIRVSTVVPFASAVASAAKAGAASKVVKAQADNRTRLILKLPLACFHTTAP